MAYLPSKKVLSFFIIVAGLVTSIIIALGSDKASTAINYAGNIVAGEKITLPKNPEWQSELVVSERVILENKESQEATTTDTLTDTVSKTLLGNYILLKQNNGLNQQSAEALVNQSVDIIKSEETPIQPIVLDIISDNSRQSIQVYGDRLGIIYKQNVPPDPITNFDPFLKSLQEQDLEKLAKLQESIDLHNKVADELTLIPVPQTLVQSHTDMISGIRMSASGLEKIKNSPNDPIYGFVGLEMFREGKVKLYTAIESIHSSINQNGIIYEQGSGGYYLLYGI